MATKKTETESEQVLKPTDDAYWEEKVTYTHPKDFRVRGDDSIPVSVNGEEIRIKRGAPVEIKRKFVAVLENSLASDAEADEYSRSIEGMKG